ncbi:amidohydrolase family protein [Desulfobulbus oligotrophicus]|uniref:Amidohydrolase family protein n=1 Tax=Desulfobulbus oligotrophicus TaxID=1909699 RepID=A0A7T6AQZ3_9BACT|nr:amidohydrolase family protein [Desulfobulbus oligotrophicus]QQG66246.1 amidohydrolase family protein [Desulfobulbus oligotrophicus]
MTVDRPTIHTADWVVPVSCPPLKNGGIVLIEKTIAAVGEAARLQQLYPGAQIKDHPQSLLTPALVNGHIHLELSHLQALTKTSPVTSFTGWITDLLALRDELGADGESVRSVAQETAITQYRLGVEVIVDVGNTMIGHNLLEIFPGTLLPFKEYLGLAASTFEKTHHRLQQEPASVRCSAHAPYSTHPRLLQRIKARANELGHIFPIHVAEPVAEGEMIREGRGEMVDFIRQRGFWDHSFQPRGQGGSINYLYDLGVLDEQTLCVHSIHVSDEEMHIFAGQGVKICLCPGSNQFLHTGTAPLPRYLDHGILPALGTDSLASNPALSLWREMRILAQTFPEVEHAALFRMATLGGAEAVGMARYFGSLEPGKSGNVLKIPLREELTTAEQVYHHLVQKGEEVPPQRLIQ